eukprot:460955-Rhodomonas_salina.1
MRSQPSLASRYHSAICLRASYAMSGTDLAHGAICARACCAMSGTDLHSATVLRACYAMPGTDLVHGATSLSPSISPYQRSS